MFSQTQPTGIARTYFGSAFVIACRSLRVGARAALTVTAVQSATAAARLKTVRNRVTILSLIVFLRTSRQT